MTAPITDPRSRALLNRPRWVYGHNSDYSLRQGCPCCGTMHQGHRPCEPTECMLCGTVQCHAVSADCKVCYAGWLPGWWRGGNSTCGYKGCPSEAVATVRKKRMCKDHAMKTTYGPRRVPMAEHLAAQIAHRDSGKGWERWTFTGPRVAW